MGRRRRRTEGCRARRDRRPWSCRPRPIRSLMASRRATGVAGAPTAAAGAGAARWHAMKRVPGVRCSGAAEEVVRERRAVPARAACSPTAAVAAAVGSPSRRLAVAGVAPPTATTARLGAEPVERAARTRSSWGAGAPGTRAREGVAEPEAAGRMARAPGDRPAALLLAVRTRAREPVRPSLAEVPEGPWRRECRRRRWPRPHQTRRAPSRRLRPLSSPRRVRRTAAVAPRLSPALGEAVAALRCSAVTDREAVAALRCSAARYREAAGARGCPGCARTGAGAGGSSSSNRAARADGFPMAEAGAPASRAALLCANSVALCSVHRKRPGRTLRRSSQTVLSVSFSVGRWHAAMGPLRVSGCW